MGEDLADYYGAKTSDQMPDIPRPRDDYCQVSRPVGGDSSAVPLPPSISRPGRLESPTDQFVRLGHSSLRSYSEAADCFGFCSVDAKNRQQSRQLQHLMELVSQIGQA